MMSKVRSLAPTVVFLALAALSGGCAQQPADPNPVSDPEPEVGEVEDLHPANSEEALEWLMAGNHRFWDGHPRHDHLSMRRVEMLSDSQHPFGVGARKNKSPIRSHVR